MCGRFFVFYSSLEGSVFFRLYAKRGSWNRKKKVAVENEKVVVGIFCQADLWQIVFLCHLHGEKAEQQ